MRKWQDAVDEERRPCRLSALKKLRISHAKFCRDIEVFTENEEQVKASPGLSQP